jgi:hypothetical protein
VRFWAGDTFENRNNAPFRVWHGCKDDWKPLIIVSNKLHIQFLRTAIPCGLRINAALSLTWKTL